MNFSISLTFSNIRVRQKYFIVLLILLPLWTIAYSAHTIVYTRFILNSRLERESANDSNYYTKQKRTNVGREDVFIIELILHPRHQVVDVERGGVLHRFLFIAFCPVILVLCAGRHFRTRFNRAELCDSTVQHADLVEKVDDCKGAKLIESRHRKRISARTIDGYPFVTILSGRQNDCVFQIATPQRSGRVFQQFELLRLL